MKVDFSTKLLDLEGEPLKDENGKEVTLKSIAQMALLANYRDETDLPADKKVQRFSIAMKLQNGADEIPVEDIAEIKRLIGKSMGPIIVGRVFELLK